MYDYIALKARFYMSLDEAGILDGETCVSTEKIEDAWHLFKEDIETARMNELTDWACTAPKRGRIILSLVSLFLSIIAVLLAAGR